MKKEANLSIVSANYNNADYLEKYLKSIFSSTLLPKEIIIVDDGSKDNSIEVLNEFHSDLVKVVALEKNHGFANSLNIGVNLSCSKYILRVDTDDYISSTRIEEQYKYMIAHPEIDLLGSNCYYFNSQTGKIILKTNVPLSHKNIEKKIKNGLHGIIHGSLICKSQILKKYLYRQSSIPAEEYDIFARIIRDGYIFQNLSAPLTYIRIHKKSVSNDMPFSTVKKTFQINSKIFNKKNNILKIYKQYLHIHFYRKALYQKTKFKMVIYLIISSVFNMSRLLNRIYIIRRKI